MRRAVFALAVLALSAVAAPVAAQTEAGEFGYSPEAQARGKAISITGRCTNGGDTTLKVTVQEGAAGDGNYSFSKSFPSNGNAVTGTIDVPDDAPFGSYVITGECFPGSSQQAFFRKDGAFAVVEKVGATTTTAADRTTTTSSSTTTSTIVAGAVTTTTVAVEDLPTTVEENSSPRTTVDEFAGTRTEEDDSIGPLLLLVGVLPLALAVGAIALAMRRNKGKAAGTDEVIDLDDHID